MSGRIIILTGHHGSAINQFDTADINVVGQSLETEQEMVAKGRNFYGQGFRVTHDGNIYVFTNNGCFYNGLRLAIANKEVDWDKVDFYYFDGKEPQHHTAHIGSNGRIMFAPTGFFDGWENSVMDLLGA